MTARACSVEGCPEPYRSLGFCESHYRRYKRHGDPLAGVTSNKATKAFMEQALASATDDCILWPFRAAAAGGYILYMHQTAHTYVCTKTHGPRPEGEQARHLCGIRICINPRHLVWGTAKENAADRKRHDTDIWGERAPKNKLTKEQVLEIERRANAGEPSTALAAEFGVDRHTIRHIATHKTWKRLWYTEDTERKEEQ